MASIGAPGCSAHRWVPLSHGRKGRLSFCFLFPVPSRMPFLDPHAQPPSSLLARLAHSALEPLAPCSQGRAPGLTVWHPPSSVSSPPRRLPVAPATWNLRPGDLQARVLLSMLALSLTWSDPRPRDRTVRTGQDSRAWGWLAPFVRNTSLSSQARSGQAISLRELWPKDLPTLGPHPSKSFLLPGVLRKGGAPHLRPLSSTYCVPGAHVQHFACPTSYSSNILAPEGLLIGPLYRRRNSVSKRLTTMSNYRLCAFPPPFFFPPSFLKSVKYFEYTEKYREEYNAPPDPVIISPYFLQFCFLKEIEDIRISGCPPFLPPPTSTLKLWWPLPSCFHGLCPYLHVAKR